MIERPITIINKRGLHARAAAKMASTAARFGANVQVQLAEKSVDSKSVMSLMLLAAAQGTDITLIADGKDEDLAMTTLVELIQDRFGEDE